jgi:hypothetical protein
MKITPESSSQSPLSEKCCNRESVRKFFIREIWFRDLEKGNLCRGIGFLAKPYVIFKILLTSRELKSNISYIFSSLLDTWSDLQDLELLSRERVQIRFPGPTIH